MKKKSTTFFFTKIGRFPKRNFEVFSTFFEKIFLRNSEAANIFLLVIYTYKFFFENPMFFHGDTDIGLLVAKVQKSPLRLIKTPPGAYKPKKLLQDIFNTPLLSLKLEDIIFSSIKAPVV